MINGFPRRLSKPRTNTSSTTQCSSDRGLDAPSQASSSQQDYFGDYAAVVSVQGERRSRRKSRSKIRAYLYGPNSETMQTPSDEDNGQTVFAEAARDLKKRMSQTGSSIMQLQSAKASTARLSDSSSSALQLTGSQSSDAEESAILRDQIQERAYLDRLAAQNHIASPVDETKHVDSVMAPVRRKSLYTPGLATRNTSDILKKPPQPEISHPQLEREYYYDPARPKESPLSQLAALQLGEDGRSTPSNLNYPQLGGLQLGTLRVTNGTTSPAPPSDAKHQILQSPSPEPRTHDDYYTASEGSVVGDFSDTVLLRSGSPLKYENKREPHSLSGDYSSIRSCICVQHVATDGAVSMASEYMSEFGCSPFSNANTWSVPSRSIFCDNEEVIVPKGENLATESWSRSAEITDARHDCHEAQEEALRKLTGDLMESSSTFAPSIPCSTKSRDSYIKITPEDDSGYSSNISLQPNQSILHETPVNPNRHEVLEEIGQVQQHDRSVRATSLDLSKVITRPVLESFNRKGGGVSAGSEPSEEMNQESPRRSSSSRMNPYPNFEHPKNLSQPNVLALLPSSTSAVPGGSVSQSLRPSARSTSTVVRKLRKSRPKSQPPPASITVQACREFEQAQIPRVPSLIAARHAERLRHFPLLDHTFPSSQHTTADAVNLPTTAMSAVDLSPFRFPSPANALEAAVMADVAEPAKTGGGQRSRFRVLSRSWTSTATPSQGNWSRSKGGSGNRNDAIAVAQDDEWPASGMVRSPSWSNFGATRNKKEQKKVSKQENQNKKRLIKEEKELEKRLEKDRKDLERQSKRDEESQKSERSRSASRTRAKSSDRPGQYKTLSDFGTVANSLGENPYDIATAMFPLKPVNHDVRNCHPHQVSTITSRPRSTIAVNEAAAVERTRARSYAGSHNFSRPNLPTKESLDIRDNNEGRVRRRKFLYDASAVPAVAAVDLQSRNADWLCSGQNHRSTPALKACHTESLNDQGRLPVSTARPQSMYQSTPLFPKPSTSEETSHLEAQVTSFRPQNMIMDGSLLPSFVGIEERGDELFLPDAPVNAQPVTLAKPHKTQACKVVPDLWSSGSLEKKTSRLIGKSAPDESSAGTPANEEHPSSKNEGLWEAQRQAWHLRRKSASEALLKNQTNKIPNNHPISPESSPTIDQQSSLLGKFKPSISVPLENIKDKESHRSPLSPRTPYLNPLASNPPTPQTPISGTPNNGSSFASHSSGGMRHQTGTQHPQGPDAKPLLPRSATTISEAQPAPKSPSPAQRRASTFTISRKYVGSSPSSPNKAMENLTGRYDGGLLYGYESGSGLGGSAGTRNVKTGASRKSVDVSRGFGLDLSDVPIFVAPMPAR